MGKQTAVTVGKINGSYYWEKKDGSYYWEKRWKLLLEKKTGVTIEKIDGSYSWENRWELLLGKKNRSYYWEKK